MHKEEADVDSRATRGIRWSRRAILRGSASVAGATGVATLAACGVSAGQPSSAKQVQGPITIMWGIRTGALPEQVNKLLDDFKSQKPAISVEQFPAPGGIDPSLQKLSTALVAGTALDVISGHLTARMLNEAIDALQPIDDLVKRDKFSTQQYNPEFLESAGKYEGKLQALPYAYGGDMVAVLYNRGMFQAAGIPEPSADWRASWTFDQWRDAARKLTKSSGDRQTQVGTTGYGYWLNTPLKPWNAAWLAPDMKTLTCDSAATLDAYARFTDMFFKDRSFAQSPGADLGTGDPFYNGKAGIAFSGTAALKYVLQTGGIDWAFAPMPRGKIASYDLAPTVAGVGKLSKSRDAAWEFLKFLNEKAALATTEGRMPATLPDLDGWAKTNFAPWPNSRVQVLVDGARAATPLEPLRLHAKWAPMSSEILEPAWKDVVAEKTTVPDMIRAVKPLLQRMIDEFERSRRK